MTPNWHWTINNYKYSLGTIVLSLRLKLWSILFYDHWLSRYKVARKSVVHRMTPNWTWTLNSKNIPYTLNTYPSSPKFLVLILRFAVSEIQHVQGRLKSEMHQITLKLTWTLNSQRNSTYTKYLMPWGPNFGPFRSTISCFRDTTCTRLAKIGNPPNDSKLNLNSYNSQKNSTYTKCLMPSGPNFGPFRSTISCLRDTTCTRLVKIGNAPNDSKLNLNSYNSQKNSTRYIH